MFQMASGARILFNAPRTRRTWLRSHKVNQVTVDPVCGMDVDEKSAKWKSTYKGKEYYFCAPGCKKTFDKNPDKYL